MSAIDTNTVDTEHARHLGANGSVGSFHTVNITNRIDIIGVDARGIDNVTIRKHIAKVDTFGLHRRTLHLGDRIFVLDYEALAETRNTLYNKVFNHRLQNVQHHNLGSSSWEVQLQSGRAGGLVKLIVTQHAVLVQKRLLAGRELGGCSSSLLQRRLCNRSALLRTLLLLLLLILAPLAALLLLLLLISTTAFVVVITVGALTTDGHQILFVGVCVADTVALLAAHLLNQ
mmetsp:Transcript_11124/g.34086  ORF Transcript_11124/g.34086 Transcript_11124/m.34086 type:complete len:230 (-) Transcript_11124:1891-2580(-)